MSEPRIARDAILHAVRAAQPPAMSLPEVRAVLAARAIPAGDPVARFTAAAQHAGARVLRSTRDAVPELIASTFPNSERAESELFVCEGTLGVVENGAIWLSESRLGRRAALFLATHVVVLLDTSALVEDLHAAYAQLDVASEVFGMFMAGPSKTADIEQSLVVGAQGPKGLTIVLRTPSHSDISSDSSSRPPATRGAP